jgi:glucarate dehydratase
MKIVDVKVTPVAFKDPPLLNASGLHLPYALRSIIEVRSDAGHIGLGETYGDSPILNNLLAVKDDLLGLHPFDINGLHARVAAKIKTDPSAGFVNLNPGTHSAKALVNAFGGFEVAFLDLQARGLSAFLSSCC